MTERDAGLLLGVHIDCDNLDSIVNPRSLVVAQSDPVSNSL